MNYLKRKFKNPAAQLKHDLQHLDLAIPRGDGATIVRITRRLLLDSRNPREYYLTQPKIIDLFKKHETVYPPRELR